MDPIAEAYREFPAWVFWLRYLFHVPAAFSVSFSAAFMGAWVALVPMYTSRNAHWTERARLLWPVRLVTAANLMFVPVVAVAGRLAFGGAVRGTSSGLDPLLFLWPLSAFAGVSAARFVVLRSFVALPRREPGALPDALSMAIILYPHVCTTLLFGLAMPNRFDWEAGIVFVAALSAVVFFMMGGNLLLARALSIAIPAGERLTEIARGMSARTGVRLNSICELRISQVNAVAFPSNRCIAFTGGLLPMLTDEEIAAVAGHELAHLAESRKVLAFRRLLMAFLPLVALNPVTHRFGFGGAAGLGAGVFLFLMFGRRVAARLETSADVGAKKWEPQPAAYAKALEKLHRAALLPAVMPARVDIHRNLYDRMVSAGVQPAFPRPSPPSKATFRFAFLGTLAAFFTCMLVLKLLFNVAGHLAARAENPVGLMAVMTLDGGGERRLQTLSRIREAKNDLRGALVFAKAAVEAGAHDHRNRTHVASLLAAVGRCDEAAISLEEARKLGWQHASDEPEEVSIDAGPDAVNMEAQDARKAAAAAARTYVDALPEIRKATEAVAKCKGSASPR